jgi:hypothetical protein
MKRNTLLVVVVTVAAFFLLFNPIQWFTGNKNIVQRPATDPDKVTSLVQFAQNQWRSPADYLVKTFATHDIVFLGEMYKIKQNVTLVGSLIPPLYAAGVRSLGIEYALSDDQKDIDALLTAPSWDEAKARAITFDWLVTWGFQEYIDLYKAAWTFNHGLAAGAKPFRILGLSARVNWQELKTTQDTTNVTVIAKLYANGIPDAHIAEVIKSQLIAKGEKALIYTGQQHAFTRYRSAEYEKNATAMKLSETRRAGNIIYEAIGSRAFSVTLHAPWPDATQKTGFGYPAGGLIDAMIDALPDAEKTGGWDAVGTPLGALSTAGSVYAGNSKTPTLADMCDGYIVQGPIMQYTMVTPLKDFVTAGNVEQANANFPGVKPDKPYTVEQFAAAIQTDLDTMTKTFVQFR